MASVEIKIKKDSALIKIKRRGRPDVLCDFKREGPGRISNSNLDDADISEGLYEALESFFVTDVMDALQQDDLPEDERG